MADRDEISWWVFDHIKWCNQDPIVDRLYAAEAERDRLREQVTDYEAEAERRGAERGWQDALDLAGDESHDLRINLCGETDWSKVEDLLWSHLEAIADANPYRAGADVD